MAEAGARAINGTIKSGVILNTRLATSKKSPRKTASTKTASTPLKAKTKSTAAEKRVRKPPQPASAISSAAVASVEPPAVSDGRPHAWVTAVRAAEEKKAIDVRVLDLREVTSFCDFFIVASGSNPKQVQAIAEGIDMELRTIGERAISVEGYDNAEWILSDYGDFIVHVFSEKAREFYDLERLWRAAKVVDIAAAAAK